jgi:hypothetical protein
MSSVGEGIAAALYVASNVYSWRQANAMPKRQAAANREVLALQKEHYDAITDEQRRILRGAIAEWMGDVEAILDNSVDFEEAYPEVPTAAEYVPVDACCEQLFTIECNIQHTDRADAYVRYVSRLHEQNDLEHALSFDKGFLVNLDMMFTSIQRMIRGQLPVGDVVEVLTDNAEQAALYGRVGNTRKTTARDLGISKLRMQAAGRREFREAISWVNSAVSPLQRLGDIRDMMQRPQERISLALAQAQLIQQSLQNKNNALAQKEPFLMAKLQTRLANYITKLQFKASEALLTNNFVPNYAATVVPKTDNTAMLLGGLGSAIQNAQTSWFYGGPPKDQSGYRGQQDRQVAEGSQKPLFGGAVGNFMSRPLF